MADTGKSVHAFEDVDAERFRSEVVPRAEPALLPGLVADWPIVTAAGESAAALAGYVQAFGPQHAVRYFHGEPGIRGRFFYSDDLRGFNFEKRETTLADLLQQLLNCEAADDPPSIYAGAIPLRDELAALLAQNANPLLDSGIEQLASIWIGNRGRTATHWDLPQNIACVVAGRRRFTLFPPEQLPNLYIGPIDFTLAGQPISLVDLHNPDFERFPRFREALASAQVVELGPGDALYLPSMWFHHVESLDALGMLINFWWRDAAPHMFTPLFTLLHGLLSLRDLPEAEREIWRGVFDHYIFSGGEDAMRHVPEAARGVYGELTPEKLARLRAHLIRTLGGEPRRIG